MAPQPETVAVLGMGSMGYGMATSALRAGIPTIVWSRHAACRGDLAGLGAEVADTAAEAAARAGIVITMVTNTNAVMSIAKEQGMLDAPSKRENDSASWRPSPNRRWWCTATKTSCSRRLTPSRWRSGFHWPADDLPD
jgi:3-hydroxyisobutyrate dehydrogenase-like beta-hydroxyacid dehydrogenase